jgi:septal ring factor EnvC (AmiA/AmiB activator)
MWKSRSHHALWAKSSIVTLRSAAPSAIRQECGHYAQRAAAGEKRARRLLREQRSLIEATAKTAEIPERSLISATDALGVHTPGGSGG